MTMKLYHFMESEYLLDTILNNRIKLSTFQDLNDPYEVMADMYEDGYHAPSVFIRHHAQEMLKNTGLFCMTSNVISPIMWSIYADRHKGVALGFEFSNLKERGYLKVKYSDKRVPDPPGLDLDDPHIRDVHIRELLSTKALCWKHEQEYRRIFSLDNVQNKINTDDNGLIYCDIIKELKRIILGVDCGLLVGVVRNALKQVACDDIQVTRARLSDSGFDILIDP